MAPLTLEHLEAIGEINLRMESGTWSGNVRFVIMKKLAEDVILGQNYLQTFNFIDRASGGYAV